MINSRALWILIMVSFLFLLIIFKLFDIQILKNEHYIFYAKRQQNRTESIKAERGFIYDRNDVLLVYNRNDISLILDRAIVRKGKISDAAKNLSAISNNTISYFLKLINEDTTAICIEKKAPNDKRILVKNHKVGGLFIKEDPTRIYHYNNLAAHVIGYVDNTWVGMDGVEKFYNNTLKGEDGVRVIERGDRGRVISIREDDTKPPVAGSNIQLTIDKKIQSILEEELRKGLVNSSAVSASGIIMNPQTGEIIALANVDDYDPNNYSEYSDFQRRNRCITDTYEPGSTFKSIMLASLLDQKLCDEDEILDVENGRYFFMGRNVYDTHKFKYLSVKGIFEQSSNIGMCKLSQRIGGEELFRYLRNFGFGAATGVELPGEVRGSLSNANQLNKLLRSSISRGYGIRVTPIQLAAAYCAIVNGGVLYQPRIIKKIFNPDGSIECESSPKEIRRIISQETSERMKKLMESVVQNGTGKNAKLDFISVGGKTGTAEVSGKADKKGYVKDESNASFVGFFPVDNPQIVILILLNSSKAGRFGGVVAAPIFREVAKRMLTSLDDSFKNDSKKYKENDEDIHFVKTGGNSEIEKYSSSNEKLISNGLMPDLRNHSMREAIVTLTKLGLKYNVAGSGKVISQSIPAGKKLTKGSVCKIICSDNLSNSPTVKWN